MAPHSSTLAWKHPWTEEPGRLQSMGSLRVRYDWVTSLSLFTFMHWRRKWQPTPVFLPGESQGRGSLVAAVYGVAQSQTQLKRLSTSWQRAVLRIAISLWTTCLTIGHGQGNGSCLLFLPYLELHSYNHVIDDLIGSSIRSIVSSCLIVINFIGGSVTGLVMQETSIP